MKKIGIVTIVDYDNYGNRLQNYAVQEILKSYGFEVETIKNVPVNEENSKIISKIRNANIKLILGKLNQLMLNILKKSDKVYIDALNQRRKSFLEFTNNNISESDFVISPKSIPLGLAEKYDYFVVGSDQVWNYNFRFGSSLDFLTFAPKNIRIALSPSFGVSEVSPKYVEKYSKWLSEFKYLSVREEAGAKIIKKLINRDASVLIDPTMMFDLLKWEQLFIASKYKPKNKYILTYILGNLNEHKQKEINNFAIKNNLVIFNLADKNNTEGFSVGPSEFLDLINDATVFFTDSFHGSIFSILFQTPFVVIDREDKTQSMNSRLETLLKRFNLQDRNYCNIQNESDYLNTDFTNINKILIEERTKMNDFLSKALSSDEG
ncbi:polysaccharide pyruvyl transferase family protein [uncultured Vagococcus sp.]|uniref:polysaccharide pyruvyl transferase family protein n=1 Tax=uncultured Vagococcus sp. TaxID=189676 RepID=UPI0028D17463|nr:polysaccharide pyruvyl transferase family protein [uncultured Vagococcus sp.]